MIAEGRDPIKTEAEDVMTRGIIYCQTNQSVEDAIHLMEEKKIRRMPVLNAIKRLVGMLSLGDISHNVSREMAGGLVRAVSDQHK